MIPLKILLTGCNGLLGQRVVQCMPANVHIIGIDQDEQVYIHGKRFKYIRLDITDRKSVKCLIDEIAPAWIINTAAYTDVDGCETNKEICWRVNVEGVENLVKSAKKFKAKFIHISSDYIFDGKKELYKEDDKPSPLSYYGRSKLASENIVRASGIEGALLRTSTLYDIDTLKAGKNFPLWVIQNLQKRNIIKIVTDQWGNPTLARNLASAVWRIVTLNRSGVYHTAGRDNMSRYTFARRIADIFGLDDYLIQPITTTELGQAAKRPLKIGIDISKAEAELDIIMIGVEEGLKIFKKDYLALHRNN
jgi:dTDP-4-dehydrorhamnose reductase